VDKEEKLSRVPLHSIRTQIQALKQGMAAHAKIVVSMGGGHWGAGVDAWDRDGRILFHDSLLNVDIIWKLTNFVALEQGVILINLLREGCMRSMQ
jgi:hypothetical protein